MSQPAPTWYVLVEESVTAWNERRWDLTQNYAATDQEHAMEVAKQVAFSYRPRNPSSPQSRSVFRGLDGSWLVLVRGASSNFRFRVTVAEWFGDAAG